MEVTVGAAARALSLSEKTVRKWVRRGVLRATRAPSGWHYITTTELARVAKARSRRFAK